MAGVSKFLTHIVARFVQQLPHLPKALGLVWTAARSWTTAWAALLLVQSALPVATVFLTREFVDRLTESIGPDALPGSVRGTLTVAIILGVLMITAEVARAAARWVRTCQAELIRDHISSLIHQRAIDADIGLYESPAYHDLLHRARVDSQNRPIALVENLGTMIQSTLTLLTMAAVLIPFGWWVPVSLVVSTLPALWVVVRFAGRHHAWLVSSTQAQRRGRYYDWLVASREAAPEIRIFSTGPFFAGLYQEIRSRLRGERIALARSESGAQVVAGGFALIIMVLSLAVMVLRTLRGGASLGDLAMFYQAFSQGQRLMRALLETVGQLYSNILFLENLFEFLDVRPRITSPPNAVALPGDVTPSIEFENVTFRYPSSKRPTLSSFSLRIDGGSTVAILGANGAGKSTLFKLVSRFYDPENGRVLVGGVDVRKLDLTALRKEITVLFQEPVRYSETVRENIALGAIEVQHSDDDIYSAASYAGARDIISRLPDGLSTLLGTWFTNGADLSLGEWQRLSLARAALRKSGIVLLDEPTSSMDSWAEIDWIRRLKSLVQDRTAVIITHRLTTALHADVIHVMSDGEIIESGTHTSLLDANGKYASAWINQGRA